ncbi:MAG: type IV pilus assembly protein PilM [Bdellovibrionota bacterium]
MLLKGFATLLGKGKDEPYIAVDIGSSSIKLLSLDLSGSKPRLLSAAIAPTPAGAVANNTVMRPEQVAQSIRTLLDANDMKGKRAIFAVPGPSAFTKKISIGRTTLKDLTANIGFEAGNYIPHSIDAVHLDFQVLKAQGKSTIEVLLVAVKNDVVRSFVTTLEQAGLEPLIADVDYFALENMFELNYPEERNKTVALINIGSRYSSVSILSGGDSLFTGDVGVGGRLYTDTLCETLGMQPAQAEQAKAGMAIEGFDPNLIHETRDRTTEHLASELHRQIGFFWNAAATDKAIEAVYLCGGSSQVPGLVEELSAKTGMSCSLMKTFRSVEWNDQFDEEFIGEIGLSMGVGVGLAIRHLGDKKNAID